MKIKLKLYYMPEQRQVFERAAEVKKNAEAVWFLSLLGLATLLPFFHLQMVTGPLVNAVLFIAAAALGWRSAAVIAFIPSAIAFSIGLLPAVLGPMIPFIIVGNAVLVVIFCFLWKKNYWLGVGAASFCKFLFLFTSSRFLFGFILHQPLGKNIAAMMSWPQLHTALLGGAIAYIFLKFVKRI